MNTIIEQMPGWDRTTTVVIYVMSVFFATLFAKLYDRTKYNKDILSMVYICFSFMSIWGIVAFSTCGADYSSYKRIFESSLEPAYWQTARIERGYIALNALVRLFTKDFVVFRVIWAFMIIFMVYKAILSYEEEIDVSLAVMVFASIYIFQSMNLMRMYFTMAVMIFGFKHFLEGRKFRYLLYIIVCFFLHRSSLILAMPLAFSVVFRTEGRFIVKTLTTALILSLFILLRSVLLSSILFDNAYDLSQNGSMGIANIIYHVPLVVLFFYVFNNEEYNSEIIRRYFIFFLASFLFIEEQLICSVSSIQCFK